MDSILGYVACFWLIPSLVIGGLGFLLGWFLKPKQRVTGDLTVEGEGALRAEADSLRARVQDLEGRVATRDTEVSDLKGKLAAAAAGAAAASAAGAAMAKSDAPADDVAKKTTDDDDTYALEWQNRYLAARVKYLESRIAEAPAADTGGSKAAAAAAGAATLAAGAAVASKAKSKPKAKAKAASKPKAAPKPKAAKPKTAKPKAAARPKPKVLYTDGPTDGEPDDLKKIKGIGPKFERDLNSKGIYYYRQIGAWKRADVSMVEGVIDSFPGRIDRDGWIPQAKQLAKGGAAAASMSKTRAVAKPKTTAVKKAPTKAVATTGTAKAKRKPAKSDSEKRMDRYFEGVRKYDSRASREVVEKIVKYCGVSLRSRDTSLVACRDEAELKRIERGFATKKLGLSDGKMELIQSVCEEMKAQRQKNRVTFYYLMAKKAGKLDVFK